jgi:hypothetical protein
VSCSWLMSMVLLRRWFCCVIEAYAGAEVCNDYSVTSSPLPMLDDIYIKEFEVGET